MSTLRILVVGDAMLDVVVQPKGAIAQTSDTTATVRMSRGGAAANLAVSLAKSSHDVYFLGVVANDIPGKMFYEELLRCGVTPVLQNAKGSTGVVVAMIESGGQRAMLTDRGVNSLLSIDFVIEQIETGFDHVHVSGYTFLDPSTSLVGEKLLHYCDEHKISSSVDVCSLAPLQKMGVQNFLSAVEHSSFFFANEEEALAVTQTSEIDAALSSLRSSFNEVVVTRGADGAVAARNDASFSVRSQSSVVLDTTGAGDAATGAYLAARLDGNDVNTALNKAMAAAAIVVRGLGSLGHQDPR